MTNKVKVKRSTSTKLAATVVAGVVVLSGVFPYAALAEPIKNLPNVEVPSKDSSASNKYSVIPVFNPEKTKATTFGEGWAKTDENGGGKLISYTQTNPSDAKKGKIGVVYSNIATYEGRSLDLKITVTNWNPYFTGDKVISFGREAILHTQTGYSDVQQEWQYIDSETKKPVNVEGSFMTFVDLDGLQSITFDKATTGKIDKMYVSDDTWLDATTVNGGLKVADISNKGSVDSDPFAQFTALFSGGKMTFSWGKDYAGAGYSKNQSAPKGQAGNEYFAYSSEKPVRTEVLEPTKLVSDANEKDKIENSLDYTQEAYSYTVSHSVPDEREEFYYQSYQMEDKLIDELDLDSVTVTNEEGKDVTALFENQTKGQAVKMVAKAETLKKADFYNHTYFFNLNVKVKKGADLSKYKDKEGNILLPNKANVTVDGKTKPTNETETKVPTPVTLKLQKKIVENGKLVEQNETTEEKAYQYRLDYTIPNDVPYEKIEVGDTLEPVLNLKGVKVYDKNGKDISNQGTLTLDPKKNRFSWSPKNPEAFAGQSFYVLIDSSVKKDADLSKYKKGEDYVIPNQAYLTLDDKKQETNQVTTLVALPKAEVKPETPKVTPKAADPVESIPKTGSSGTGYGFLDALKQFFA
ncbi:isopeptide-forming domain-containing fimbrial protein [Listeria valentina]|uniref:isopeptide-forming domain-containing fimbrial protein n=1 Tax=Listeria valentina TaxID=2705293 RepID=UPI001431D4D5|nr:isopeptide-forming domain-containing fimbrial protein [Listeria valentina]